MSDDFATLRLLTGLQYETDQAAFQTLVSEEVRLRQMIAELREQARTSGSDPEMARAGADVVWRQWVGQAISDINTRLARILAQKEDHLIRLRQSYGRVLVADDLAKRDARMRRSLAEKRAWQRQIDLL